MDRCKIYCLGLLSCLILTLLNGCEQVSVRDNSLETTTVLLQIGMDGVKTKVDDINALPFEGIRTLRVVVSAGSKQIVYNRKFTAVDLGSGISNALLDKSLKLEGIPLGEAIFYIIANEESLGVEYTTEKILEELSNTTKIVFIDNLVNLCFPKSYSEIATYGLPMSGSSNVVTVAKAWGRLLYSLKRAVVKLNLVVENATSSALTLQDVTFGQFSGDRFYLFPTALLDVPDDTRYTTFGYTGIAKTVDSFTDSDPLIAYIYPTYAFKTGLDNPYKIGLKTSNKDYGSLVFGEGYNSFPRNTQVNIRARITTEVGVTINFDVEKWDDYTIDVPAFE